MPLHRLKRLALLIALAVGLVLIFQAGKIRPIIPSDGPARGSASAAQINAMVELEAKERGFDTTVWTHELEAQRHEDVILDLWNRLNQSADPWDEISTFAFERLLPPSPGPWVRLPHGLKRSTFNDREQAPASVHWSAADWRQRISQWREMGWRIGRTRWSMVSFKPDTGTGAESAFACSAQAFRNDPQTRATLRGTLQVTWSRPDPATPPRPVLIAVKELEIVSSESAPEFSQALDLPIAPHRDSNFPDPLIVQDLDGDGLPEILLPGGNLLLRNHGGSFSSETLASIPPNRVSAAVCADLNRDGKPDLLLACAEGLFVFENDGTGRFAKPPRLAWAAPTLLKHPQSITVGDVNKDGFLDLWLTQYKVPYQGGQFPTPYFDANDGFPSSLLLNDGQSGFIDATEKSGLAPKRFRRTYSASWIDLDGDGDLDLVNVSDFAGVDCYLNDGSGRFTDVTASLGRDRHLFGMAHAFADLNGDGLPDLLAIGMDSPVASRLDAMRLNRPGFDLHSEMRAAMSAGNGIFFGGVGGLKPGRVAIGLERAGWAWGVSFLDFDNDGRLDAAIANGHETFPSVTDYERQFWLHDVYVGGSSNDAVRELYFKSAFARRMAARASYGGWQDNAFFLNLGAEGFLNVAYLLGVAVPEDSQCLSSADLDGDGRMDLVLTCFSPSPTRKPHLRVYRNQLPDAGAWIGFRLSGDSSGARIDLRTAAGRQSRWIVTGDSYRTQHPSAAHFGLGSESNVVSAEIRWPDGTTRTLSEPRAGRWHDVSK